MDFEKFYNIALRLLSYRPRSEKEICDNLARKKASAEIIEKVIAKLKEQKFINDDEFVRWWVEQRTTFKPRSLRLIKIELKQKGISDELIESGIRQMADHELGIGSDLEQAKKLIEKRIERFRNLSKQEIYQKLGSYLARRGFDWDTIKQSIDEVILNRV